MAVTKGIINNLEHDCTLLCRSTDHGCQITSALTKRAVTDEQLGAYLNWMCTNCGEVNDTEGRTALHLVASCGRLKLMKYLVHVHGANLNFADKESGCTALHRAVFYGQIHIAVNLLKLGAELNIYDNGHLTAIDYAIRDRYPPQNLKVINSGEVYTWGSNENYTLGIGNQQSRSYPDLLDIFRKENISIKQISLNKFHTIFLTNTGRVYTCGHGQGGRLGNGSENTVLYPRLINFIASGIAQEPCVSISAGRDHSLFAMESGMVWSCGLNTYSQLGLVDSPKMILSPKHIKGKLSSVQNVCAARFHSVAWGPKAVFTWGLNAGQLGHDKTMEEYINVPRKVMGLGAAEITSVATSDGATVIVTSTGHIYVLHEFQCRKIGSKRNDIASISVIGGHLSPSHALSHTLKEKGGDHLRILVLTSDGLLFVWTESTPQLVRCIYSLKRPLSIRSLCVSLHHVYLITDLGEAFKGEFKPSKSKKDSSSGNNTDARQSSFTKFLNKHECAIIKVQRIPNIYRAVSVVCDIKGRNCAIVQANPVIETSYVSHISNSVLQSQMLDLLENASQEDSLHDVAFKVGDTIFPAHKYIVFDSDKIKKMCENSKNSSIIEINDIAPLMFKQLLTFLYTGTCDLLKIGPCHINFGACNSGTVSPEINLDVYDDLNAEYVFVKSKNEKNKSKSKIKNEKCDFDVKKDPIRQLQYYAKQFGLFDLYSILSNYRFDNGYICYSGKNNNKTFIKQFSRSIHPELFDVTIKSTSGNDTISIKAHRCILVARLEYFYGMFMHEWQENKSNNIIKLPFPQNILEIVIDFLYSDDWCDKDTCNDIDFICQLLIVADQLFITRLREMCEAVLAKHITIKNVATFLQFATVYNATKLHMCCVKYVCLNLAPLLENRYLEVLPDEILFELTKKYLCFNKYMSTRVLTPYSNAPSDEVINEIYEKFYIDVNDLSESNKKKQTPRKKNLPKRISESDRGRMRNESISENLSESPKVTNGHIIESPKCNNTKMSNSSKASKEHPNVTNVLLTTKVDNKILNKAIIDEKAIDKYTKEITAVQSRLRAIALAHEIVDNEEMNYSEDHKYNDTNFPVLGKKSIEKEQIPNAKNTLEQTEHPKKSPYAKISQKQRKKQIALSVTDNIKSESHIPSSAWDIKDVTSYSFANILKNEQNSPTKNDVLQNLSINNCIMSPSNNLNMSPVGSPKSSRLLSCNEPDIVFSSILADERQQRENYSKMKSKPLVLTQIEDRAIEDLEKFYNVDEIQDELITIARVCMVYSSPLWVQK